MFFLFFLLAQNEGPKSMIRLSLSDQVVAVIFKCLNFKINIKVICLFAMYHETNIIIINPKLE